MSENVLSVRDLKEGILQIRQEAFNERIAWRHDTLRDADGLVEVDEQCKREIDDLVRILRVNEFPELLLTPDLFDLPRCRKLMSRAKDILENDVGFVLIDRIPVDKYTTEESRVILWVLCQLLARPVAQSCDGKMLYDVRDSGRRHGNGVRGSITNVEQHFHTDNNGNVCPPEYVVLFCLQTAMEGGVNSVASFYSIHNELLKRYPELLPRFYEDFLIDRQREHAAGEPEVISAPLFQYDGDFLHCRGSHHLVLSGYKLAQKEIDPQGKEALKVLASVMAEPRFAKEFYFERGQIQIVDNLRCGHRRTAFKDFHEPERRRHLIRMWLRNSGRPFYNG